VRFIAQEAEEGEEGGEGAKMGEGEREAGLMGGTEQEVERKRAWAVQYCLSILAREGGRGGQEAGGGGRQ
jgi:hypothetical protein